MKLRQAEDTFTYVPAVELASGAVPIGSYVSTDLTLLRAVDEHDAYGKWLTAHGYGVYDVAEAPNLVVVRHGDADGLGPLRGQLCDASSRLRCEVAENGDLDTYFYRVEKARGPVRVLVLGKEPGDNRGEATIGIGVAFVLLACALVATFAILAGVGKGSRVVHEEMHVVARTPSEVRAAVMATLGPMLRLAEDGPSSLVLLKGKTVARARLLGATSGVDWPLRIDVTFASEAAYRGTAVTVRVVDILPLVAPGPPAASSAAAVAHTRAWLAELFARGPEGEATRGEG